MADHRRSHHSPHRGAALILLTIVALAPAAWAQTWQPTRNAKGKVVVQTKSSYGNIVFDYDRSNEKILKGFPAGHGGSNVANRLLYNLSLDGYGGLPPGSCLKRGYLMSTTDPTVSICKENENDDLLHAWGSSSTVFRNLLIKNVEVKNAFRSYNYVDGTVVKNAQSVPHTDTFQSYHGGASFTPDWMVIQDSVFKNSDNNLMIVGDTRWKGIVYQNLKSGYCDSWFRTDAATRKNNDAIFVGLQPTATSVGCANVMGAGTLNAATLWLIEVDPSGSVRANTQGSPIVVVGKNKDTLNFYWSPKATKSTICRYRYIEDALADKDASDGCGNFAHPPFIELSCAGWKTPPKGCESRQGYLPNAGPATVCGDGKQEGSEECDDGNTVDGDGCSSTCKREAPPLTGLSWEAEDGAVVAPMKVFDDPKASGGRYVTATEKQNSGSVSFRFAITEPGPYKIKVRVLTESPQMDAHNAFFIGIDGEDAQGVDALVYDVTQQDSYFEEYVRTRGETGTFEKADNDPLIVELSAGQHELTFHGRELLTRLDRVSLERQESSPRCGDHKTEGDEECDDGNTIDGDGCSSTCKKEPTGDAGASISDGGATLDSGALPSAKGGSGCQLGGSPSPWGLSLLLGLLALRGRRPRRARRR